MSALELLFTGTAHAITGGIIGAVVDANFPKLEQGAGVVNAKGGVVIAAEVLVQFSLSYLILSEAMLLLLPGDNNYRSPIGDGTSITFCYMMQPNLWRKIKHLRMQVTGDLKKPPLLTSGPTPPGVIGGGGGSY